LLLLCFSFCFFMLAANWRNKFISVKVTHVDINKLLRRNWHPPYLPLLHLRLSQTVLILSLQTRFTTSAFSWLPSPLSSLLTHLHHRNTNSVLFLQTCTRINIIKDTS